MRILRFIIALFKFLLLGEKVSKEEEKNRYEICLKCEHNLGKTCELCGCIIKAKIKMSTESCLKNKW